jgi:hypothetical protein
VADITFYSTVAQVIPVLFLAVAIDRGGFTRSATRDEIKRLDAERQRARDASESIRREYPTAPDGLFQRLTGRTAHLEHDRHERLLTARYNATVLRSTVYGTFTMLLLAVAEVAALKVTLTHNPSTVARLLCEFGMLFAGATLLFSLLDPEVQKVGRIRSWTLIRTQNASTLATFCAIALLTLVWRLL